MNVITKVNFKTAEELLKKRFYLFNKEIIIPHSECEKLDANIIIGLKLQGCYFTFKEVDKC